MSRLFRVINGPTSETAPAREADPRWGGFDLAVGGDVPFVEVGGPDGLKTVGPKPTQMKPTPPPAVFHTEPMIEEPSHTTGSAAVSRYLSVTFHRIPKAGLRLMHTGVAPEVVAYHFPDHPISGEYRLVRDEIAKQFDEPGSRVALFTAAAPLAGTTTVLVNFAVSLTHDHGNRVLVVDANFARSGVARRLGAAEAPGLAEVMGQAIPLAWALQPTPLPNLHVLATGTPTDATEEAMATDFPKLLHQLRQWFDWVVVDAGVWGELPSGEAAVMSTDAVYLVARSGDIELPGFGGLRGEVTTSGGNVRGFISTRQ
jgi:Mrp family chromosome partitioning ATPase